MAELAAHNPADRVEQLIRMTARLTDLLNQETALFNAFRAGDAKPLQAEKQHLANLYRKETMRIAQDKSLIASAGADRRAALRQSTESFNAALRDNQIAAGAVRQVTEGIVQAVAVEVAAKRSAPAGYGPGAARPSNPAAATSITLNRSV